MAQNLTKDAFCSKLFQIWKILNFLSENLEFRNPDIFLTKCQKCVEELKFCMNELFNNVFKAFSFLNFEKFTLDLSEKNC
jgi:hypothetical protein